MRVFHLIKAAGIAGAERHLLDLLPGLRANGIDAQFLLLTPPGEAAQPLIEAARARDIPTQTLSLPRSASPSALMELSNLLRDSKPDIVHTHLIHADLYGTIATRLAGIRRVIHSVHNDNPHFDRLPLRVMFRALWALTERGVCISQAVQRYVLKVEGAPADKLHQIYYGLPLPVPRYDRQTIRAGLAAQILDLPIDGVWVGIFSRLIEQKGIPYGLAAFAQVASEYPTAHLLIAGDGVLRADLEAQAQNLGLGGRVHFLGWRTDAPQLMAGLDLFLMPSLWEGFGMTLLEAMAQAVPILGSTAGAIPEVVRDGDTGLTVPPADATAIAIALRRLLADASLRQRMGLAGLARLTSHFSAEKMIQAHVRLYGDAVE